MFTCILTTYFHFSRHLQPLLHCVVTGLNDSDHGVRNAALFALGQFSEHLQVYLYMHQINAKRNATSIKA